MTTETPFKICTVCQGFGHVLWSSGFGLFEKLEKQDCPMCTNKGYLERLTSKI